MDVVILTLYWNPLQVILAVCWGSRDISPAPGNSRVSPVRQREWTVL